MRSFDQLNTRLKVGDTIWVTDAQGREIKGQIRGLDSASPLRRLLASAQESARELALASER